MRTTSTESLFKAMKNAEQRWQEDEVKETGHALTYEELAKLRKNDKITVVRWYLTILPDGELRKYRAVYRATVTRVRQHGWTDLNGFWSRNEAPADRAKDDVRLLSGKEIGVMVPSYVINYKHVDGYRDCYDVTSLNMTQIYRGWAVEP